MKRTIKKRKQEIDSPVLFLIVPRRLNEYDLTPLQKLLLALIACLSWINNDAPYCYASDRYLAGVMQCEEKHVANQLKILDDRNLINRLKNPEHKGLRQIWLDPEVFELWLEIYDTDQNELYRS